MSTPQKKTGKKLRSKLGKGKALRHPENFNQLPKKQKKIGDHANRIWEPGGIARHSKHSKENTPEVSSIRRKNR